MLVWNRMTGLSERNTLDIQVFHARGMEKILESIIQRSFPKETPIGLHGPFNKKTLSIHSLPRKENNSDGQTVSTPWDENSSSHSQKEDFIHS